MRSCCRAAPTLVDMHGITKTVIDVVSIGSGHPVVILVLVGMVWAVAHGLYGKGSGITKRTGEHDPVTTSDDEVLGGSKRGW